MEEYFHCPAFHSKLTRYQNVFFGAITPQVAFKEPSQVSRASCIPLTIVGRSQHPTLDSTKSVSSTKVYPTNLYLSPEFGLTISHPYPFFWGFEQKCADHGSYCRPCPVTLTKIVKWYYPLPTSVVNDWIPKTSAYLVCGPLYGRKEAINCCLRNAIALHG